MHNDLSTLNRWLLLATGFVIELILGLLYAWSIFILPLEQEFGWARAQTSLAFTVSLIFFPLGMIAGGYLIDARGTRYSGSLCALLLSTGFLLTSFTNSIPWLIISYGVVAGFGIGIGSNAMASLVSWFPDRRALAAGLLTMGFGLGGLVLGTISSAIVDVLGWRTAFQFLAATSFAVCLGGSQWVAKAPPGWKPAGWNPPAPETHTDGEPVRVDFTTFEMLRTRRFWFMEIWFLLVSAAGVMMIGHIVPMALELGIEDTAAVLTMGLLSLSNGLGRVFYGALSDKVGRAQTMFLDSLLMALAILFAIPLTGALGFAGLVLAVIVIGAAYGGGIPQTTAMVMQYFGPRNFGANLGITSCHIALGGVLGPLLAGYLRASTGSYNPAFTLAGAMALVACGLPWLFARVQDEAAGQALRPKPAG